MILFSHTQAIVKFNAYLDWIATRFPHGVRTVTLLRSLERDNLSKHFDLPALLAVFGSNTTHLALAPSYIELHFESGGVLKNGELDSYKGLWAKITNNLLYLIASSVEI